LYIVVKADKTGRVFVVVDTHPVRGERYVQQGDYLRLVCSMHLSHLTGCI